MRGVQRWRVRFWAASLVVGATSTLVLSGCLGSTGEAPGEVLDGCGPQRMQLYVSGVEQGPALMVHGSVGYSPLGPAMVSGAQTVSSVSVPAWAPHWSGQSSDASDPTYRLVAVDAGGTELASVSFSQPPEPEHPTASGNADVAHSIPFCAALPLPSSEDVSEVARFRLLADERVSASVVVASGLLGSDEASFVTSKRSLQVFGVAGYVQEYGEGSVSWSVRGGGDDVNYTIRYRSSAAAPWQEVAAGEYPSHATHAAVDVDPPTDGGAAFEAVARDGSLEVSVTSPPLSGQE